MVSALAIKNIITVLQEVLQCPNLHIKPKYRDLTIPEARKLAKELNKTDKKEDKKEDK